MPFRSSLVLGPALAALALVACGARSDDAEVATGALEPRSTSIAFTSCSLQTGGSDGLAECANVDVPLGWDNPGGQRANFFVKRLRGSAPGPHKQVWLLEGGPGGAGDGFEWFAPGLAKANPTFDIYLPDHRGTGRSTYLDCPQHQGDDVGCAAELRATWGQAALDTFTTSTAARDVGFVIDQIREPDQEVHVYGVSYGTYWAQRYLQLFPNQPTAVTLDSICQQGLCSLLKYGYWVDHVGRKFMGECANDAFCAGKLGPDPVAKVRDALAAVDSQRCTGTSGLDTATWRDVLGAFAIQFPMRPLVPALTYRILRCNAGDAAALKHFTDALMGPQGGGGGAGAGGDPPKNLFSNALSLHIALSEMLEEPPVSRDELKAMLSDAVFTAFDPLLHDTLDAWPRYPRDAFVGAYPTANVPVLLLNGTLDGQTPIEFFQEIAPHYNQPAQTSVVLPRATHATALGGAPMDGTPAKQCGMDLWQQFLVSPRQPIDTSCTGHIQALDFASAPGVSNALLGTPDLWEGVPVTRSARTAADDAVLAQMRQAIREAAPFTRALRQLAR
jgi:pimeloyl-ACP methyl ester carboxylesterase